MKVKEESRKEEDRAVVRSGKGVRQRERRR